MLRMKSKNFNTTKQTAFDTCKKVLIGSNCNIISSDFATGKIEAKKSSSFLSYGHILSVAVETTVSGKTKISISSSSVGIQIIDWGTNSNNEDELFELISNSLR